MVLLSGLMFCESVLHPLSPVEAGSFLLPGEEFTDLVFVLLGVSVFRLIFQFFKDRTNVLLQLCRYVAMVHLYRLGGSVCLVLGLLVRSSSSGGGSSSVAVCVGSPSGRAVTVSPSRSGWVGGGFEDRGGLWHWGKPVLHRGVGAHSSWVVFGMADGAFEDFEGFAGHVRIGDKGD